MATHFSSWRGSSGYQCQHYQNLRYAAPGYRWHTLGVTIRKYGDPRKTATHTYTTVYFHCDLNEKLTAIKLEGQLSLPIPAAVLAVDEPVNPVVVTWKPGQKLKPKQGVQPVPPRSRT